MVREHSFRPFHAKLTPIYKMIILFFLDLLNTILLMIFTYDALINKVHFPNHLFHPTISNIRPSVWAGRSSI